MCTLMRAYGIINRRQRNDVDDEKENQLQIFTDLDVEKIKNRSIINLDKSIRVVRKVITKDFPHNFCANLMIGFKMSATKSTATKLTVEMFTEALSRIADLETRVVVLEEQLAAKRPAAKSENSMTEEHAFRVKFGDLKDLKHGKAAEALGLSYGQVFSCRGGYTFKTVTKDWKAAEVATAAE